MLPRACVLVILGVFSLVASIVGGVCRGKVCCARAFHFPFKCSISSLIIVLICLISYPVILGGLWFVVDRKWVFIMHPWMVSWARVPNISFHSFGLIIILWLWKYSFSYFFFVGVLEWFWFEVWGLWMIMHNLIWIFIRIFGTERKILIMLAVVSIVRC